MKCKPKIFSLLAVAGMVWLLQGCGGATPHNHQTTMPRFQSVHPEQAVLLQSGEDKTSCSICGMHLPSFYKTNHVLEFASGQVFQFCSIHCLSDAMEHQLDDAQRKSITAIKVVDAATLRWINAKTAHYVIGSNRPGTMSMVSKYAFGSKADAQAFAAQFGGELGGFDAAYDKAAGVFSRKHGH